LCVEACPKKCLRFTHDFEPATFSKEKVILDLYNDSNLSSVTSTYGQPERKKEVEGKEGN